MRWWFRKRERVRVETRPMTPDEEKAFDAIFVSMRGTFDAMEKFFDTVDKKS